MRKKTPSPLGQAICGERYRTGETQVEFGARVGLAGGTVARIERGEMQQVKSDVLRRIAGETRLSANYLLGLERHQPNYQPYHMKEKERTVADE